MPASTFGFGSTASLVTFHVPPVLVDLLSQHIDLSFSFRSRKANGLLMYLGPQLSDTSGIFLVTELQNNNLVAKVGSAANISNEFILAYAVTDGEKHYVDITIDSGLLTSTFDSSRTTLNALSSSRIRSQVLYMGSFPATLRSKRQSPNSVIDADFFKGIMQDPRLNGYAFVIAQTNVTLPVNAIHATNTENIWLGEVSENVCEQNPSQCFNNGTCENVFYEDFR